MVGGKRECQDSDLYSRGIPSYLSVLPLSSSQASWVVPQFRCNIFVSCHKNHVLCSLHHQVSKNNIGRNGGRQEGVARLWYVWPCPSLLPFNLATFFLTCITKFFLFVLPPIVFQTSSPPFKVKILYLVGNISNDSTLEYELCITCLLSMCVT